MPTESPDRTPSERPSLLASARARRAAIARVMSATRVRPAFRKRNRSAFVNFLRAKYEAYTGAVTVRSYPYYLSIDPADVCQLRCPTCPTGIENERKRGPTELRFVHRRERTILEPTVFDALLDEVGEYLFMIMFYNYGEPLLNKQLPRFIRKASALDIETEIHTNLSLPLSDHQIDDLMGSGLDYLNASIDGFSQETYQVHRVGGDLELVKRNLERLVAARERLGATTEITYKFLVFRHNEHEVPAARAYCEQHGINFIHGDSFISDPSWLPTHRQSEQPYYSDGEISERMEAWNALGQADYWSDEEKRTVWYPKTLKGGNLPFCNWHYGVSVVTAGGPVSPCCAASKDVDDLGAVVPGEVRFADVWNGERVRRSRAAFASRTIPGLEHVDSLCLRCYFPKFVQQLYSSQDAKVLAQFYRQFGSSEPGLKGAFDLLCRSRYNAVERPFLRRGVVHQFLLERHEETDTGPFVEHFERNLSDETSALPAPDHAADTGSSRERFRLTVDAASGWTFTRAGWHPAESTGSETFRWSRGSRSALAASLPAGRDIRLTLDCQPFVFPGCPAQRITIVLNGTPVDEVTLLPGRHEYVVALPGEYVDRQSPPSRLEFRYAYARRPRKVLRQSDDERVLAVAWYAIHFEEVVSCLA